jgi:hypothetical protein
MAPICRARGHFMKMAWPDYARREIVAALAEEKTSNVMAKMFAISRRKPPVSIIPPRFRSPHSIGDQLTIGTKARPRSAGLAVIS